jgi:hypothetical protein
MDIARDTFKTAVTDMVRNGKIQWDELGKYMLVRLAEWGIDKIMGSFGKTSGGTGGIGESLTSGIMSLFGGTRDSGGRGQPGMAYAITPKAGTEVFWPDSKGKFYPNVGGRGGGGVTIHQNNNFGNGGDDRAQQRMLAEANRRLVDELERSHRLVNA